MNITKIVHIADIHIRNFKRHKEYFEVFKSLFKQLKEAVDESTIIFLGGDIVHSKTDMTPELISLTSYFIKSCADLCPTILILGNHDTNLKNENRLDALTPIVKALNHSNLYYWKDSGVYHLNNITFSVFSVLGSTKDWILAKDIDSNNIKIALHHGSILGSKTDLDHIINNEYVKVELFDGFDYVLLGDIHKRQYLNSEQTIHYPGSLIQQDHGESLHKGFTIWNLKDKSSEFYQIKNDIGYVTLNCKDNNILTEQEYIKSWPKKLRLRIKHENCTKEYIQNLIQKIKKNHHIEEVTTPKLNTFNNIINKANILDDVRDIEYQNSLITEYLENIRAANVDFDYIRHINRVVNSELNSGIKLIRNIKWTPKKLEFSNMFSYGPNNIVVFENLTGIQGVFAANASGKSSLLDIFTYCIYDKCSRAWKAKDILNNQKSKFVCKLELELAGENYVIERSGFKGKTESVRVEVDFYKIDLNGNKILLNGQDRDQTNKLIRDHLGTYDDFLLTTLSTQNDNKNFIFKTQRERKELLYSFLDLAVFEELQSLAKKYIKSKSNELSYAELELNSDDYISIDSDVTRYKFKESELTNLIDKWNNDFGIIQSKLNDLNKQLIPLSVENIVFTQKEDDEIIELDLKIKRVTMDVQNIENLILTLDSKIYDLQTSLKNPEYDELDSKLEMRSELSMKLNELNFEIEKHKGQIEHIRLKLEKLNAHEYDPNCQFCVKNEFVQDAKSSEQILPELENFLQTLVDQYQKVKYEFDNTNGYIKLKATKDEHSKSLNNLLQERNTFLSTKMNQIKSISTLEERLITLRKNKEQYIQYKDSIEKNESIKELIAKAKQEQDHVTNEISSVQSKLTDVKANLLVAESKVQKRDYLKGVVNSLKNEVASYEIYIDMMHNDNLPYMIVQKILPVIENEVNLILNDVVDFYVKFEPDEKSNINCYLLYTNDNRWPVEMASGMERFIISLAIRCALVDITNLPRPSFMAIDEGFGVLDSERISSLTPLFDYMRTKFGFIIVVSHVDTMRDMVDGLMDVNRNKQGFSEIHIL